MNVMELTCPNCGAKIQVAEDAEVFVCPCCGSEITLLKELENNSPKTVSIENSAPKTKKSHSPLRGIVAGLLAVAVIGGVGYAGVRYNTSIQIKESKNSVRGYIDQKDFSRARSELGTLFNSHFLFKEKWNSSKNALENEINEKEEEYFQTLKRAVPMSKKDAEKESVNAVMSAFTNAGFTNIKLNAITDPAENPKAKDQAIKEISVKEDGEEKDFKAGDSLKTNAEIVITYYDFSDSPAVPMSSSEAKNKDKNDVEEAFKKAGFCNVKLSEFDEPQQETDENDSFFAKAVGVVKSAIDTVTEFFSGKDKSGKVQAVSILHDGKETTDFKKDDRFPSDAVISITYYK